MIPDSREEKVALTITVKMLLLFIGLLVFSAFTNITGVLGMAFGNAIKKDAAFASFEGNSSLTDAIVQTSIVFHVQNALGYVMLLISMLFVLYMLFNISGYVYEQFIKKDEG